MTSIPVIPSDQPPSRPARLVDDFTPPLILPGEHHFCPTFRVEIREEARKCGARRAVRELGGQLDELTDTLAQISG